jgi:hypothetical protein
MRKRSQRGDEILIKVRWADLEALLGLKKNTLRKYGSAPMRKFNPRSLPSVVRFYEERRQRKETR